MIYIDTGNSCLLLLGLELSLEYFDLILHFHNFEMQSQLVAAVSYCKLPCSLFSCERIGEAASSGTAGLSTALESIGAVAGDVATEGAGALATGAGMPSFPPLHTPALPKLQPLPVVTQHAPLSWVSLSHTLLALAANLDKHARTHTHTREQVTPQQAPRERQPMPSWAWLATCLSALRQPLP